MALTNDHGHGREYICGAASSFVNIVVTFPMYKVMFRQQLQGIRVLKALHQIRAEGIYYLYRGIGPPLISRTLSVSLMFGAYSQYMEFYRKQFPEHSFFFAHVFSAMAAGTTEAILLPFERTQVLLQVPKYHDTITNTSHAFVVMKDYGVREYYRGLSAVLLRNGPSNILFFGLRQPLKNSLPYTNTPLGSSVGDFVSGAGLGACLSTLFYPLNTVKNHMQAKLGGEFVGVKDSFMIVLEQRQKKFRKMFRGVHLNYTRSMVSWGITNTVYEFLMAHFEQHKHSK